MEFKDRPCTSTDVITNSRFFTFKPFPRRENAGIYIHVLLSILSLFGGTFSGFFRKT